MRLNLFYHRGPGSFPSRLERVFVCALVLFSAGCKKLVEVKSPPTSLTSENIYSDDATAASVLTGIYTSMSQPMLIGGSTLNSISLVSGLSADELSLQGGSANAATTLVQFYTNNLNSGISTNPGGGIWNDLYAKIYIVNLAYERLSASTGLTPSVRQQLMGEAKFMRAFFYSWLVNLYGDVPLTTSSDYRASATLARSSKDDVWQQIITDLTDAQGLLGDGYVGSNALSATGERLRPNKWAATALLARAYLYHGDWQDAETQAGAVIGHAALYDTVSLDKVFLSNSQEAIWQLQPVNVGWNTEDGRIFVLPPTGPTSNSTVQGYPVYLSPALMNSFEPGDLRRSEWVDSVRVTVATGSATYFYPYKYRSATLNAPVTEYTMVLRLGEQYLIRAEARAELNNVAGSQEDLNLIRTRAGLPNTAADDMSTLLTAILQERRVELFTEWGHRWMDLKRTGAVDAVMVAAAPAKGTVWNTDWQLYPIPAYDIVQDPNIKQNHGY